MIYCSKIQEEVKSMKNIELGFLIFLLLFNLLFPFSSGETDGVCRSQGGRFPPFSSDGKPPKKLGKGHTDLTLCRLFRKMTCCDAGQTHPALLSIRRLALTGEASQECLHLWELLECSICDPQVGVRPGPPLICTSFCDRVFRACSNAYFSMDVKTQALAPCGVNDVVCGRASEWASNGTELCLAAGFGVKQSSIMHGGVGETSCYGGKASLASIADSWGASRSEKPHKTRDFGPLEEFQQWMKDMPSNIRVSWAVGGMVLTAGLLFLSKRKTHSQRQKLAAIQRAARRLEGKMNQTSLSFNQGNRKGSRR